MNKKIFQGEIWWINPIPKIDSEQRGKRPALIIQNDIANKYLKTTIVAVISSSGKIDMPEMVPLNTKKELEIDSSADFAQIFTISKSRLIKKVGKIKVGKWKQVKKALDTIFLQTIS